MLLLQEKGAHNINLVTPTHYVPNIAKVLRKIKNKELTITHNIDSDNIVTKKNKVHGIKIKYITNDPESEDD